MANKITIYDIAKKLNLSASSVSRGLNNSSRVSKKTTKLIHEAAAAMNFKPNRAALALKSGKSNIVGVIVPQLNNSFHSCIIKGLEDELYLFGYQIVICQSYDDKLREIENVKTLLSVNVDGIFISATKITKNSESIKSTVDNSIPLIFFNGETNTKGVSCVNTNDFEGAYKVTKHLIDKGCTKIALLHGDLSLEFHKNRFEGYKKALKDYSIKFNQEYILQTECDAESGKNATIKLLKNNPIPDAIFASEDYVALGAIQELNSRGIKVPKDVCVAGFNNRSFTELMELSITSVDQSPIYMGKMGAKVFLEQINNSNIQIEKKIIVSPKLHIRNLSSINL